jgi:hypothetical protein
MVSRDDETFYYFLFSEHVVPSRLLARSRTQPGGKARWEGGKIAG